MKHLTFALLAVLLSALPVRAGLVIDSYKQTPCSYTPVVYAGTQTSTTDTTSYTFNGVSIGLPPCGTNIRLVVTHAGCHSITSGSATLEGTVNGGAMTDITDTGETNLASLLSATSVPTGTTADLVFTSSGAADSTCERLVAMVWVVITSSATRVDTVTDASPTGDFDLVDVAVTSGGAETVSMITYPSATCADPDSVFNGTETVTQAVLSTLESAISYTGGYFTADSTATTDDYTNLTCGTETDGSATALSWQPPTVP